MNRHQNLNQSSPPIPPWRNPPLPDKAPQRTARRLLGQLKSEGLLSDTSSRSPLRWEIPEHAEPWYFPELVPGV
jgi:hypothetical protein